MAALDKFESVATYQNIRFIIQLFKTLAYEVGMIAVGFHANDLPASSRYKFEADAACSRKEIEGTGSFEIEVTHHDIKDVFFGKIGGGTCLEGAWNVEMTAFILAGDDSHKSVNNIEEGAFAYLPFRNRMLISMGSPLILVMGARLNSASELIT